MQQVILIGSNFSIRSVSSLLSIPALANGYNLSSIINDAPVIFEDENLESVRKPQTISVNFMDQYL